MAVHAVNTAARRMSAREFRAFESTRPEGERWELIGGVPVMMPPPTIAHNHLAENLTRLLNEALADHDPMRMALQRTGIELGNPDDEYRPEPDVVVIDAEYEPGQRYVERTYLLGEIVSSTDYEPVPGKREPWIEVKRRIYLAHPASEAVVIVEQDRVEVRLDVRTGAGWTSSTLKRLDDELILPSFGLRCRVADLYAGTPIARR